MDNDSLRAIGDELIGSIRGVFPNGAEIETCMDGSRLSFVCTVYWKLGDDISRPNKPSKIILIIISYEAIEDSDYHQHEQAVKDKLREFIKTKYKDFNPNHNEPRENSPPNEEWIVVSNILL